MVNSALEHELDALDELPQSERTGAHNKLLDRLIASSLSLSSDVQQLLARSLADSVGIASSRQALSNLTTKVRDIKDLNTRIEVCQNALGIIEPRVVSFEEQDSQIKEMLADAHEQNQDYIASAKALQSITLASSQRSISDIDKAKVWIRITRCYLEENDPTNALIYLNRVKNLVNVNDLDNDEVRLQFQLSQARIYDSQRNFLDASSTYHLLSEQTQIDHGERLQALSAAIVCAILAPAGPKRVRQLARLYQDEHAPKVDEHGILEKIYLDRILTPAEVSCFSEKLSPHQKAVTPDGSTVLGKAVLEHNLLAASRLYSNISTSVLGDMLGVGPDVADLYAAQMIEQGRLMAYIDQIDERIFFDAGTGRDDGTTDSVDADGAGRRRWDAKVQALVEEVELVAGLIKTEHPDLFAQHMVH